MIYPEDERIKISKSVHSIAVSRDVTTPGYGFPSEQILAYQKPFLAAGMQGLSGCLGCTGLMGTSGEGEVKEGLGMWDYILMALGGMLVVPHFLKK